MRGEEHAGYLDIKLPPKNRSKRSKVWCNRWVVLHKVNDLSVAKMLAKLDLYTNAEQASSSENKISSIFLEHVTSINMVSRSKTHPNAFEICEGKNPVLYFSAATLTETQLWACFLREIFKLNAPDSEGLYHVWVRANDYSNYLGLTGDYSMTVTSDNINIAKANGQGAQWPLSSLKTFYLRPITPEAKHNHILIIEPGESFMTNGNFIMFVSPRAEEILLTIRTNIFIALRQRSRDRSISNQNITPQLSRYNSLPKPHNPETQSLHEFQRSCSIDTGRRMSTIEPEIHSNHDLLEASHLNISRCVPPPKPVRTGKYVPTSISNASSPMEEVKQISEESPLEEQVTLQNKPEARKLSSDFNSQIEPVNLISEPFQGDDQRCKQLLRNNCGSMDSGVLSFTSEMSSFDLRQQPGRSDSADSAISMFIDRQKAIPQTSKPTLQTHAITETSSKSSESDKESDDYSGSHIYWDIEPEELCIPQTDIPWRRNSISFSRCHSLQNLLPSEVNDYEDLTELVKEKKKVTKNAPPALPKRPKSLALHKDKSFSKTSMKDRFLGSLSNISPQTKQKKKNRKFNSGTDDLNMIIKDFRKWSELGKKTDWKETSYSRTRRMRQVSETTYFQNEVQTSTCQRKRHLNSWPTSETPDMSWIDKETKEGVFMVERKVKPFDFLLQDPFRLTNQKQITRHNSLGNSTVHTEDDDFSPVLTPVAVNSHGARYFLGSGHWSDGDMRNTDGESDQDEISLNRRRSISLEGKLEYQIMIRQLKKELEETTKIGRPLPRTNPLVNRSHGTAQIPIPQHLVTPPTTPILATSPKLNQDIMAGYIEMTGRIRSSSTSVTTCKKDNQKRKTSLR